MDKSRRNFIKNATATGAAILAAPAVFGSSPASKQQKASDAVTPFKLKYAPGLTMFRQNAGQDIIDNIKFCHDMGFRAIFDNNLMGRTPEDQVKITNELTRLGMDLGPFVLMGLGKEPNFVINTPAMRETLANKMKESVEVAKRTGARWALIAPGVFDMRLHMDYQTANAIDNLRLCCDILEPAGLTIVLEPLNTLKNHPGSFLTDIPQSYAICRAVNRPSCKIVDDLYHQQISEGNLISNIEAAWSEIGAFHLGDNPGRNEPTTGEINFKNIFKYLYNKKYDGTLCMEHGISNRGTKEGELRVIEAYRECDSFEA
jgi:hydroxypyruvate isomerase